MKWEQVLKDYQYYLKLERGFSDNTIVSYTFDIQKFISYISEYQIDENPENISQETIKQFIYQNASQLKARSQARLVSTLNNFFKFVIFENYREDNPMELVEAPKFGFNLPDVLSVDEIDQLQSAINMSNNEGHRNKAMLEVLYGCGLRVTELITLRLSDLFFEEGFIQVLGKGNKKRLVPINNRTQHEIQIYINNHRKKIKIVKGYEDFVFLNRRGTTLTRAMVFTIVRRLADNIGLQKTISPHTFRHSFASHLLQNGANLRSIQLMLGHESITTTEIYMHTDKSELYKVMKKYHPREKKS